MNPVSRTLKLAIAIAVGFAVCAASVPAGASSSHDIETSSEFSESSSESLIEGPGTSMLSNALPPIADNGMLKLTLADMPDNFSYIEPITGKATGNIKDVGASVSAFDLASNGVSLESVDFYIASPASGKTDPNEISGDYYDGADMEVGEPAATKNYPVMKSWKDYGNRPATLRTNINDKLVNKHNITYKVPRTASKRIKPYRTDVPTKYGYDVRVKNVTCTGFLWKRHCVTRDSVIVRTVIDYRNNTSDKKSFGVVTSHCLTRVVKCPNYVKNAINQI